MRPIILIALSLFAGALCAQPTVASVSPSGGSQAATTAVITATFNETMQTPGSAEVRVYTNRRAGVPGSFAAQGNDISFTPSTGWLPNEQVTVVLTTGVQGASGNLAAPYAWQFRVRSGPGAADFSGTPVTLNGSTASTFSTACADLNGDDRLDIAFITSNTIEIYLRDASGNYNFAGNPTSLSTPNDFALGDVDNDGDLDMAVGLAGSATINRIYYNDGNGNFGTYADLGTVANYTIGVAMADLDGDGWLDVISAAGGIGKDLNIYYLNDGAGNFPTDYYFGSMAQADNSWFIATGDVDNDGDIDVAFANYAFNASGQSCVCLNDGSGGFSSAARINFGYSAQNVRVDLADFNNDGWLDAALCAAGGGAAAVCLNNSGASFAAGTLVPNTPGASCFGTRFCDVNGDGNLDLYTSDDQNQDTIELGDGTGGFVAGGPLLGGNASRFWTVDFADLDGDGDTEAITPGMIYPNGTNNPPPGISVSSNGSPVADRGTLNVAHNATLASLGLEIAVTDGDGDQTSLSASISNLTTQGIALSEFSVGTSAVPYSASPTSGTFDVGSVTHTVTLKADDGETSVSFEFEIVVGPVGTPQIGVADQAGSISNGGSRSLGNVVIGNSGTPVVVTISNTGTADLSLGTPTLTGAGAAAFALDTSGMASTVAPGGNTSFQVNFTPAMLGSFTATVEFSHDDATTSTPYTFTVSGDGIDAPPPPGGASGGGDSDSGGGCTAVGGGSLLWLLLAGLFAALCMGASQRRRA